MKRILLLTIGLLFIQNLQAQSNDCATATPLTFTNGSTCVNGTTANATSDNILYSTCNVTSLNEVWYTYVTEGANNDFQISSLGLTNAQIVVYTGGCGVQLEFCNNVSGTATLNNSWGIAPGTQVWIGVMSNEGVEGNFQLCVDSYAPDPSGGNTCAGAIPICEIGTSYTIDMTPLNSSGVTPSCFFGTGNLDVWIEFTVTQAGTVEWGATPSNGDVELDWAMYNLGGGCPGPPGGPGTLVACNYNYAGGTGAPVGMNDAISCVSCPTDLVTYSACQEYCSESFLPVGTYAIMIDFYQGTVGTLDFMFTNGTTALISPIADFTVSPTLICGPSMTVNITNSSIGGAPDWTFGNGNSYSGSNPPDQTYNTPGTYAITATIPGACPSTMTEYVQLLAPLAGNLLSTNEVCQNDCNGSATLDAISGGDGVYIYQWYDAAMSAIGGETNNSISGLCSGDYTLVVSNAACGSTLNLPVTISYANVQDDPAFTTTGNCDGGTSAISGTGGGTFSFGTPTGDGATIDPVTGTVTNGTSGAVYDILYTTGGTCPASQNQNMNVLITDNPAFTMSPQCDGGTAAITGTGGGSFNFDTPPVDAAVIDPITGTVSGGTPGNSYDVEYVTGGSCPDSMVVTVVASNGDDPSFTMTATCEGGTAAIIGTGGGSFNFDVPPGDGATIDPVTGEITNGTPGMQYSVEYVTNGTCADSSVQQVTALPQDDPTFNVTPSCDGGTSQIVGDIGGTFTFSNAPSDAAVIDPSTGTVTGGTPGMSYNIQYVTAGICPDSTVVTLTALAQDDPTFTVTPTCDGGIATVTGTAGGTFSFSSAPSDTAVVNPSNGTVSGGSPSGNYDVQYLTSGSCPDSMTVNFTAYAQPPAPTAGDDSTYCSSDFFADMYVQGIGGGYYTWYQDPGLSTEYGTGNNLQPVDVEGTTTYYVTETVNGCEGPASLVIITIEMCEIVVPTAITPNADGINDTWEVRDLDNVYPNNVVRIYNRWGSVIFEHDSQVDGPYSDNQWDGKVDGDPLPVGSYYFIIEFNDKDNGKSSGAVSILKNN